MKAKAFLLGTFLLIGTASTFASSDAKASKSKIPGKTQPQKAVVFKKISKNLLKKADCTVAVSYTNSRGKKVSITISASCDCTQQEACNVAYELASIAIPD